MALAATVTLAAAIGVGHAADLAVKAATVRRATPYNWTGCYSGGFVGWGVTNTWKSTDLNGFNTAGVNPWDFSLGNEATGGGVLGCNWQANSWLVLGIEGKGGYLNVEGSASPTLLPSVAGVGNGGLSTVGDTAKIGSGSGLIAGRADGLCRECASA